MTPRLPLPPFDATTAALKVQKAEDAWNMRNPAAVAEAYSVDSVWRNRSQFLKGRQEIERFLTAKWAQELEYRLSKQLWTFAGNRIAVRFAYEWHDAQGRWWRSYGNENWEFDELGYMRLRLASINDLALAETERKFHWVQGPRPKDAPSLSALGL